MSDAAGIRVRRRRGYTIVYNDMLPPGGVLSARAWGIYCYLLSRPDGWECRVSHLRNVFKEGRDAIYVALRELVDVGLMHRENYVEKGLKRVRYALDADDVGPPQQTAPETLPDTGFQDAGNPHPEKAGEVTTEGTTTEGTTAGAETSSHSSTPTRPLVKTYR
jgi:hypothetical protein